MSTKIAVFAGAAGVAVTVHLLLALPSPAPAVRPPPAARPATVRSIMPPPPPPASPSPPASAPPPASPLAMAPVALPAPLQQAIADDLSRLHDEQDVAGYLRELEARARRQGHVTALELEPGAAAIRTYVPPERAAELSRRFFQQMTELSDRLEGRTPAPAPDLDALAHRLEYASQRARPPLIRDYLDGAMRLPPDQQAAALQRLSAFASPTESSTSTTKGVLQ